MEIRSATFDDLDRILAIYSSARAFMIASGNPNQWGLTNPPRELIVSDIEKGILKVIFDETGIHGVFALFEGDDPTYANIENGSWPNDEPYVTIHSIAGDGKVHGIFKTASDYCKKICANVRIDTHADNKPMQRKIIENGFVKCGIIHLANGSPRIAYQWTANR